ncbi:4-hydroxy-tetrahydrodipicolinate reductase [Candidatus Liberibacter sp.]|uniref:4-hydroxy-tetrahydrodipicolinate reductase n=1 Tax=Candidatus Liberibacter sp. TaxID=34022 RepID=UPI0015F446A9|nr:4-hydroxy-tetrahydrodipicolinate reductase [Candidatus Liberibacter sp.]MBA5724305.1 4-hydroxy-tetrahydrodipicolinate reductase [Candidatus Liberibacter sp.]
MIQLPIKIAILGGGGRMGHALIRAIREIEMANSIKNEPCGMNSIVLEAALVREGSPLLGTDVGDFADLRSTGVFFSHDIEKALQSVDVVIDFSSPELTLQSLEICPDRQCVHIIGTTGFSEQEEAKIVSAAQKKMIVKSSNMSVGINVLSVFAENAARCFNSGHWDFEIQEMHHRHKLDAPSGTALLLGKAVARGRQVDLSEVAVWNHNEQKKSRQEGSIGFATLRGGSVVGEHSVVIAGEGETITLSHTAQDRSIFARGAITAAIWAGGRLDDPQYDPGLYSMLDVLGMKNLLLEERK